MSAWLHSKSSNFVRMRPGTREKASLPPGSAGWRMSVEGRAVEQRGAFREPMSSKRGSNKLQRKSGGGRRRGMDGMEAKSRKQALWGPCRGQVWPETSRYSPGASQDRKECQGGNRRILLDLGLWVGLHEVKEPGKQGQRTAALKARALRVPVKLFSWMKLCHWVFP